MVAGRGRWSTRRARDAGKPKGRRNDSNESRNPRDPLPLPLPCREVASCAPATVTPLRRPAVTRPSPDPPWCNSPAPDIRRPRRSRGRNSYNCWRFCPSFHRCFVLALSREFFPLPLSFIRVSLSLSLSLSFAFFSCSSRFVWLSGYLQSAWPSINALTCHCPRHWESTLLRSVLWQAWMFNSPNIITCSTYPLKWNWQGTSGDYIWTLP